MVLTPASSRTQRYFSATLAIFLLSFVVMASSKWTNNIFYAFIALPGLVMLIKQRGAGLMQEPLTWLWLAFLAWFLVPAGIAGDGQFYKHIIYTTLFVMVLGGLVDPNIYRSSWLARGQFWILALYISASCIYGWASGHFAFGRRVDILPARLENVIYASIWLLGAMGLALPTWERERRWIEGAAGIVLAITLVTFALQTRTALVGAAVILGLYMLWTLRRFPRQGAIGVAITVALLIATWLIVREQAWYALLWARGDSHRTELIQIMLGEWHNCGITFGCGIHFHTTKLLGGYMPIQHPHNIFISLGVYAGLMALLLFLAVVICTLWQAWKLRDAWGLFLVGSLCMLNFDGSLLIGNPDELWPLVIMPAALILGRAVQARRGRLN